MDKRIREAAKLLLKNNNSRKVPSSNNKSGEVNSPGMGTGTVGLSHTLEKERESMINQIVMLTTTRGNNSYTVGEILNDYLKNYESEVSSQLTKREKKRIDLIELERGTIISKINSKISDKMISNTRLYDVKCDSTRDNNIQDFLELNTAFMSIEEITEVYKKISNELQITEGYSSKHLQINFAATIFKRQKALREIVEDTKLTHDIAVGICKKTLHTEPKFKERILHIYNR